MVLFRTCISSNSLQSHSTTPAQLNAELQYAAQHPQLHASKSQPRLDLSARLSSRFSLLVTRPFSRTFVASIRQAGREADTQAYSLEDGVSGPF